MKEPASIELRPRHLETLRAEMQFVLSRLSEGGDALQEATPCRRYRMTGRRGSSPNTTPTSCPSGVSPSSGSPHTPKYMSSCVYWRPQRSSYVARIWQGARCRYQRFPVAGEVTAESKKLTLATARRYVETNHEHRPKLTQQSPCKKRRRIFRATSSASDSATNSGPPAPASEAAIALTKGTREALLGDLDSA